MMGGGGAMAAAERGLRLRRGLRGGGGGGVGDGAGGDGSVMSVSVLLVWVFRAWAVKRCGGLCLPANSDAFRPEAKSRFSSEEGTNPHDNRMELWGEQQCGLRANGAIDGRVGGIDVVVESVTSKMRSIQGPLPSIPTAEDGSARGHEGRLRHRQLRSYLMSLPCLVSLGASASLSHLLSFLRLLNAPVSDRHCILSRIHLCRTSAGPMADRLTQLQDCLDDVSSAATLPSDMF